MKANELRLGNWILDYEAEPNVSIYWQVESIEYLNKTLGIRFRKGSCWTCEEMIEPIPLTEEWLLKFGFDRRTEPSDKWYVDDRVAYSLFGAIQCGDEFILQYDDISYIFCIATTDDGMESYETLTKIKYVHQLQNLYFALTGEELTIKNE